MRVLHIRDGQLVAEDRTSIQVAKRGAGAFIYQVAHEYSVFYGLFAIAFAVLAGWVAAAVFRKAPKSNAGLSCQLKICSGII